MTTVAVHQPDLLPYSGFWYKMAHSDVFVLLPFDQFQKRGYQRRVTMMGMWCSHVLVGQPWRERICDVLVSDGWAHHLVDVIRGRYRATPYWKQRGDDLCDLLLDIPDGVAPLDVVNTSMIRMMRGLLGIHTFMVDADPGNASMGAKRVLDHVTAIPGATRYLCGTGARAYMSDAEEMFARERIEIEWSQHKPPYGDSILTPYFFMADPMEAVMSESVW